MTHLKLIAAAAAAVIAVQASPAAASYCEEQAGPSRAQVEAKVIEMLGPIDQGIAEIKKHGGDPGKIGLKADDGTFKTLPDVRTRLLVDKAAAGRQIDEAVASCTKDLKPLQDVTDAYVDILTGGLSKVLPKHMLHVDVGQILLAGKPFGGDGAIIPHLREQILAALGLKNDNGFITSLVRDPLRTIFGRR
ncbi:hypothetical protein ASE63_26175 [Bosea sp. Root381]|uniref:hypothetical protein n=1 Tax=Bosea sp. Root381 TaxID=1736524 RepID=UPI0006F1F357|nr:hypothetical protein [Bosea sp. Root381]KRE02999.1 hypothetical protein ASE63_26175 [Bosea sp. Root381]